MAVSVSAAVWAAGPRERTLRYVLLALADHADPSGFAFPSIALLADKCVLTGRSVIGAITQLEHEHWITKTRKGKANQYQINVEKLGIGAALGENGSGDIGEQNSCEEKLREIHGSPQVKSTASIGEIYCKPPAPPYRSNRQEPSLEPSGETSSAAAAGTLFPLAAKQPAKKDVDLTAYVDLWNERCGSLPKVRKLTKKRKSLLASRIAEGLTFQQFDEVLAKIQASPHLLGANGWKVSFGWVIASDDHITDILEGTYDPATSRPKPVRKEMAPVLGRDNHAR